MDVHAKALLVNVKTDLKRSLEPDDPRGADFENPNGDGPAGLIAGVHRARPGRFLGGGNATSFWQCGDSR